MKFFLVHKHFTNMTVGHITQPGGLWGGDPWCKLTFNFFFTR